MQKKTEVILFVGLHAVQNEDKNIESNILASKACQNYKSFPLWTNLWQFNNQLQI